MNEQEAFTAYYENSHIRKFPRKGQTGMQIKETLAAFQAGVAYARMIDLPSLEESE